MVVEAVDDDVAEQLVVVEEELVVAVVVVVVLAVGQVTRAEPGVEEIFQYE